MQPPDPPVNVRLVLTDGTEIAVDTVYNGIVDRLHHWVIVNGPPVERIKGLRIDALPGRTSVTLAEGYTGE